MREPVEKPKRLTGLMDQSIDQPTIIAEYRVACTRLKRIKFYSLHSMMLSGCMLSKTGLLVKQFETFLILLSSTRTNPWWLHCLICWELVRIKLE